MTHWVKAGPAKLDNLSLIYETHMMEEMESTRCPLMSDFFHKSSLIHRHDARAQTCMLKQSHKSKQTSEQTESSIFRVDSLPEEGQRGVCCVISIHLHSQTHKAC